MAIQLDYEVPKPDPPENWRTAFKRANSGKGVSAALGALLIVVGVISMADRSRDLYAIAVGSLLVAVGVVSFALGIQQLRRL